MTQKTDINLKLKLLSVSDLPFQERRRKKKKPRSNSSQEMEPIDTNINHFMFEIINNNEFLSLSQNSASLSPLSQKRLKIREIKFDTKIEFQKIKGINYLIAKKDGKLKLTF